MSVIKTPTGLRFNIGDKAINYNTLKTYNGEIQPDQDLLTAITFAYDSIKNSRAEMVYPFELYETILDYYEEKYPGYKKLLTYTLFLHPMSEAIGKPYPIDRDILYTMMCEYLLENKEVCYDVNGGIYMWNFETCLFHPIKQASDLINHSKKFIEELRSIFNAITTTLTYKFSINFFPDPNLVSQYTYLMKHLSVNYSAFKKMITYTTTEVTKHLFTSLKNHFSSEIYKVNIIDWLLEQGFPGFIPFKDGFVFDFRTGKIVERTQQHAFCDSCTLLSMRYDAVTFMTAYLKFMKDGNNKIKTCILDITNEEQDTYERIMHLFGVSLTGVPDKRLWCLYSPWTDSGKSLIGRLLELLLGNKAKASDHKLISGNTESTHETEKVKLISYWLTTMDETGRVFFYNEKSLQSLTAGGGNKIGGRKAHSAETEEGKLTTTLLEMTNYLCESTNSFRKTVIQMKCGFCADPDDPTTYPISWWADKDAGELMEGLKVKGVIKKMIPGLVDKIQNSEVSMLDLLVIGAYYACDSIQNQAANDKKFRSENMVSTFIPASVEAFLNYQDEPGKVKTTDDPENRFNQRDNNARLADLVSINEYYNEYVKFAKAAFKEKNAVSLANLKVILMNKNLMRNEVFTNFVKPEAKDRLVKLEYSTFMNTAEGSLFELLPHSATIGEGIKASEIHEFLFKMIDIKNLDIVYHNKMFPLDQRPKLFIPQATEFVKFLVNQGLRHGKGRTANGAYYHIKVRAEWKTWYDGFMKADLKKYNPVVFDPYKFPTV